MKVKKGDYVINWCEDEGMVDIGQVATEPTEDGEFDLDFIGGGTVSPASPNSVVIPQSVAEFLSGALDLLPIDEDGTHRLPQDLGF